MDPELKEIEDKIVDAKENLGDSELVTALLEKAEYYTKKDDKENTEKAYGEAMEKTVGVGKKIDIVLALVQIGCKGDDRHLMKKYIDKAVKLLEEGGDWERRNKLKVYQAIYAMTVRDFKRSADLFLDSIATFSSEEIMSYKDCVFYTVITSVVSLERPVIKERVIGSAEILTNIRDIDHLKPYLECLYKCNYNGFFRAFVEIIERLKTDKYLKEHARYYVREMRIVIYKQFLEAYKSVTLINMAASFGISAEFLDKELSDFISTGRINCKIDKVAGVIESSQPDERNILYQKSIRQGDQLLNRVHKLSKVIDL